MKVILAVLGVLNVIPMVATTIVYCRKPWSHVSKNRSFHLGYFEVMSQSLLILYYWNVSLRAERLTCSVYVLVAIALISIASVAFILRVSRLCISFLVRKNAADGLRLSRTVLKSPLFTEKRLLIIPFIVCIFACSVTGILLAVFGKDFSSRTYAETNGCLIGNQFHFQL